MNQHYFTNAPQSAHDIRLVNFSVLGNDFSCETDAGVFSRDGLDAGSRYLLEALPRLSGDILDLGCGWGAVGIAVAKAYPGAKVVMAEVNERAAKLSQRNCAKNGVSNARIVLSDGFSAINGAFDAIITNPPIRAGKALVYGWLACAKDFLRPGGALYIVIRKQQGAQSALTYLKTLYPRVEILDKSKGFFTIRASVE